MLLSTPTFVIAVVLQILTIKLEPMRSAGNWSSSGRPAIRDASFVPGCSTGSEHLLLPTITLALDAAFAFYSRYQRNMMLDTLHADYVRTARAKGLTRRTAVFKHALRTALIPVGTLFAFSVAGGLHRRRRSPRSCSDGTGWATTSSPRSAGRTSTARSRSRRSRGVTVFVGAMLSEVFVVLLDPRVRVG